jgi:hypothetical protein
MLRSFDRRERRMDVIGHICCAQDGGRVVGDFH